MLLIPPHEHWATCIGHVALCLLHKAVSTEHCAFQGSGTLQELTVAHGCMYYLHAMYPMGVIYRISITCIVVYIGMHTIVTSAREVHNTHP